MAPPRDGSTCRGGPYAGRLFFAAALSLLLAACGGGAGLRPAPEPGRAETPLPPDGGAFTVAESALDTWNTIGKIVVALDGVEYEGRSQMLGLYVVRYRGERFLLRARALPIEAPGQGLRTRVDALGERGQRIESEAAAALLQVLARRVPAEVARYRQPVRLRPDARGDR